MNVGYFRDSVAVSGEYIGKLRILQVTLGSFREYITLSNVLAAKSRLAKYVNSSNASKHFRFIHIDNSSCEFCGYNEVTR